MFLKSLWVHLVALSRSFYDFEIEKFWKCLLRNNYVMVHDRKLKHLIQKILGLFYT